MRTNLIILFLFCLTVTGFAQIRQQDYNDIDNRFVDEYGDSTSVFQKEIQVELSDETFYEDYKIINQKFDTTYVDTTLTINKNYSFNFLRKDNLDFMPFHNPGQSYNNLAYQFADQNYYPKIGARAQHNNFYEVEDINYYEVPTPTTELMWRTVLEQGFLLDALFAFNLSRQFNMSLAFKGLRSLGKYRASLTDHGNFRLTMGYHTKNKRYYIRGHLVAQDIINDQNGGLTDESITNFENDDPNFKDRARLETNFTDASNTLRGNRYYFDHFYKLWDKKDSLRSIPSDLKIGHVFNAERKHYEYEQDSPNAFFGPAFTNDIADDVQYQKFFNEAYLSLNSPVVLGEVRFKANYFYYEYQYKSILISDTEIIPPGLDGDAVAVGGEWHTKFKKFNLDVDASTVVSGTVKGHSYSAMASFKTDSLFVVKARAFSNSRSPNFNFLLYQSAYKRYNWQNDFENEQLNGFEFIFDSKKWLYASVRWTNIENYAYFGLADDTGQTSPLQATEAVNYLRVDLSKEFKFGNFRLDNQFIYQQVASGEDVFRVPDFITRNTFYYANHIFKGKPMYLETGITFKYFSEYLMNAYNPLISEFHLQNDREFGGFPLMDYFINFRVKTMRVYFTLEHFNSLFTEKNYYSAPTYPYRDFVIRLGLVWNFFI